MKPSPRDELETMTAIVRGLLTTRTKLTIEGSAPGTLPPEVEEARTRLDVLDGGNRVTRRAYYDLLYTVGVLLSESRRPLSMGEVSSALSVSVSTATRIVDWQVRYGYAERLSDPNDRRRVLVALTDSGRAVYAGVERHLAKRLKGALLQFSQAERKQLAVLLPKLAEGLAQLEA